MILIFQIMILGISGFLLSGQSQPAPPPHTPCVGWIEQISGHAYLKGHSNENQVLLDEKHDRYRCLHEDELVRVDSGGVLKIQLGGKTRKIEPSRDWSLVRRTASLNPDIMKSIESYGHIGGRDRSLASAIFSPAPGSTVRAGWLSFRWLPEPGLGPISLVIYTEFGEQVWRQDDIDGTSGNLNSDNARNVIEKYKDGQERRKFILVIIDKNHHRAESPFLLLPASDERLLDHAIQKLNQDTGFIGRISRAYWFDHYGLCSETVQEYEAALALAPESHDLIAATIQAEMCTGNLERIDELRKQLNAIGSNLAGHSIGDGKL